MAKEGKLAISVNWDVAKKLGKEKFLKQHSHLSDRHIKELTEMFDKKFGKPAKEEK